MNYFKIVRTVLIRTLPIIICIIAILFFLPMASTNNAQEQCLDNRMAKLQQRTQDCILLTKMFEKAEQGDDIFIPDADKKKVENGRRVMHVIKETLLVELGCIYPKEMEFPK